MAEKKIVSFDIFDLCLIWKCGKYENVFDVLSYHAFTDSVADIHRLEFAALRNTAERNSNINDIYATLDFKHPKLKSTKDLIEEELQCIKLLSQPVLSTKKTIDNYRANGYSIFFLSSINLPYQFIKSLLQSYGLFYDNDNIHIIDKSQSLHEFYNSFFSEETIAKCARIHYASSFGKTALLDENVRIDVKTITLDKLPYEYQWENKDCGLKYHYSSIAAGIGRSINYSITPNTHNTFAIDIAAPFLTSFAYRIFADASKRNIKRLYFCSRDCYGLYQVVQTLNCVFPEIECVYFYTSRQALYEGNDTEKTRYFESIKLATKEDNIAIVDIRSTGKTLSFLNEFLTKRGYKTVFGYFFEMYCNREYSPLHNYYCEINSIYSQTTRASIFGFHDAITECLMSMCPDKRTVDYKDGKPVKSTSNEEETHLIELDKDTFECHKMILHQYAKCFIDTELYKHNDVFFNNIVIPTIISFLTNPHHLYLESLKRLFVLKESKYIPYVTNNPFIYYYIKKKRERTKSVIFHKLYGVILRIIKKHIGIKESYWEKGTIILSNSNRHQDGNRQ